MKGAKDGKGEGNKQQQAGPALFPRLHVAETKQVGPRAPPRNKMALYEQFTIPFHRFRSSPVPLPSSTQNSVNPSMSPALAGSYDGRYSYGPSYMSPMSPALAYVPSMNAGSHGVAGQVSMNGTSSSTVVDGDTEMQLAPFVAESSVPTSAPTPSKNGKVDCTVPTYSVGTRARSQRRFSLSASQSQETASRGHHPPSKKTRDSGKEKRFNIEMPGGSDQLQLHQIDGMSSEQAGVLSEQNGGLSELNGGLSWHIGSVTTSVDDCNVRELDIEQRDADIDIHLQESDLQNRDRDAAQQPQLSLATAPNGVQEAERLRGQSEQNHYGSETSENVSEVSEQRGQGFSGDESESSMLDYVRVENVTPHDVMSAIGQQQFWRARKTVLRQQKMFSVQVFELHRLMEVQQQMAKDPSLILEADEEEVEEQEQKQEEQQQVPAPAPVTPVPPHVPQLPAKFVEGNGIKQCNTNRLLMTEAPKLMYPVPFPHQQSFLPGQPWQATPHAANEQGAQMAPQYVYLPYPPPYPPAYGYHPVMHPNMMMYEQNGVQHAQMPSWQQQGCSYGSGALGPGSARYSALPHVPVMVSTQQGVSVDPSNYFHPLDWLGSLGASSQMHVNIPTGKQGEGQSPKAAQAQDDGWAKGWGTYQIHVKHKDKPKQGGDSEGAQLQGQQHSEKVSVRGGMKDVETKQADDSPVSDPLPLFPLSPVPIRSMPQTGVIKVVPRAVLATPESTAGILLSIQQERQQ
ncbi:unnamed protein product [Sphagnum compactum]